MKLGDILNNMTIYLLYIVLFGTFISASAQLCNFCECCKNNNCVRQATCPDGCIDGYWDDDQHKDCRNPCLSGCQSCTNGTRCDACIDGYYGPTCEECPYPCKTCNGTACLTCVDGTFGVWCNFTCPTNCKECDTLANNAVQCTNCVAGFYGSNCSTRCNYRCIAQICNIDGTCACRSNFVGAMCDRCLDGGFYGPNCNTRCSNGCIDQMCNKDGTCQCRSKFAGEMCDRCEDGRYGIGCWLFCPATCHTCNDISDCVSCKPGYYDLPVCTRCPDYNCKDSKCLPDGRCESCELGYFGDFCESNCSSKCLNNACDWRNGTCTSCVDGFFGESCDDICPTACTRCSSIELCTLCKDGYFGQNCLDICPLNCLYGECFQDNGTCTAGCVNGYGGEYCSCPIGCNCNTEWECVSCKTAHYGPNCSSKCSDTCVSSDTDIRCSNIGGTCLNGCVDGFYGSRCTKKCKQCVDNACQQSDGQCIYGYITASHNTASQAPLFAVIGTLTAILTISVILNALCIYFCRKRNNSTVDDTVDDTIETAVDKQDVQYENAAMQSSESDSGTGDVELNNYDSLGVREERSDYSTLHNTPIHSSLQNTPTQNATGGYYNIK